MKRSERQKNSQPQSICLVIGLLNFLSFPFNLADSIDQSSVHLPYFIRHHFCFFTDQSHARHSQNFRTKIYQSFYLWSNCVSRSTNVMLINVCAHCTQLNTIIQKREQNINYCIYYTRGYSKFGLRKKNTKSKLTRDIVHDLNIRTLYTNPHGNR